MIDTTFDARLDSAGRDPDAHSATLRRYHQILWSKPLPCGQTFDLDISGPKPFLVHRSHLGEFHLTSDSITHTYARKKHLAPLIDQLPDPQREFATDSRWLIGESIVFPGKRVDRLNTINGARGMHHQIGDRFDLTLECIRRHYAQQPSPLADVLSRYSSFFALFQDFPGYVSFFLLQDLVTADASEVKFYLPLDHFTRRPIPQTIEEYSTYLSNMKAFATARANRMQTL